MFSKLLRAITGYKVKRVSINGLEIKISYRGKMPSSDPFACLKELKLKLNHNPQPSPVNLDLNSYWEDRLTYLKDIYPTYIAKFQVENELYRISRFVTKQNRSPLSIYTFSNNDKIFAVFSRVYDYGNFFTDIENDLIANHNFKKSDSEANLHYITNKRYSALVDVFGHSQSFFWNDQDELDKCLDSII